LSLLDDPESTEGLAGLLRLASLVNKLDQAASKYLKEQQH
jgi:hypothetical protein